MRQRAGDVAGYLAEHGRHEGAAIASEAAQQAARLGRTMRRDPVPFLVGAVGLALIANLAFNRRR